MKKNQFFIISFLTASFLFGGCKQKKNNDSTIGKIKINLHNGAIFKISNIDVINHQMEIEYPDNSSNHNIAIYNFYSVIFKSKNAEIKVKTMAKNDEKCEFQKNGECEKKLVQKIKEDNKKANSFVSEHRNEKGGDWVIVYYNEGCYITGCFNEEPVTIEITKINDIDVIKSLVKSIEVTESH